MSTETLPDDRSTDSESIPVCEKCNTPLRVKEMSVCPRCGYYPRLGIFVDVDPSEADWYDGEANQAQPKPSHLDVWLGLIPGWGWGLIVTSLAVVLGSIAVRLLSDPHGSFRTTWSVSQLLGGLSVALVCHVCAFLWMLSREYDLGVTDVLLKPLRIWIRMCSELPKRFWMLNIECASLTAALSAALIIGGIPYERLWDWGIKPRPKQNLMGAIMDQAKKMKGDDKSLEESAEDLAGQAGNLDDDASNNDVEAAPRLKADCVVIGYGPRQKGKAMQLWLASTVGGKLAYVGRVTPRLDETEIQELLAKLGQLHATRAFVPAPGEPQWVRPALTCRITYSERDATGRFTDVLWDELLGEVKLPW